MSEFIKYGQVKVRKREQGVDGNGILASWSLSHSVSLSLLRASVAVGEHSKMLTGCGITLLYSILWTS